MILMNIMIIIVRMCRGSVMNSRNHSIVFFLTVLAVLNICTTCFARPFEDG